MKTLAWVIGGAVALLLALGLLGSGHSSHRADAVSDICSKAMSDAAPGGEKRSLRLICDEARRNIK